MALRPYFNALLVALVLLPATGLGGPAEQQKCKLPWAVYNGGLDAIDELIAAGCDPNEQDQEGSVWLHWVSSSTQDPLAVTAKLLAAGAKSDIASKGGWRPTHMATMTGQLEVVRLLLAHGADPNAATDVGTTLLHLAPFQAKPAMVDLLVDSGASVNATDQEGSTALHITISRRNPAVARRLLMRGADVHAEKKNGQTALHLAAAHGRYRAAKVLLEHGANAGARDGQGRTPEELARLYHNPGHEQVADLLREAIGAGLRQRSKTPSTAGSQALDR